VELHLEHPADEFLNPVVAHQDSLQVVGGGGPRLSERRDLPMVPPPNFFADDCGWFHISPTDKEDKACCEKCFRGPLGQKHQERWGVGDR
jgi:hypothetical protein